MTAGSGGGCARGQAWRCQHPEQFCGQRISLGPLDFGADDIDDLVRQARNVLVAQVDGDARVLLLHLAGGVGAALADVLARVREGGLCEGDHLLVGNGHGRVVAHDRDRDRDRHRNGRRAERRAAAAEEEEGADMLMRAQAGMQTLRRRGCAVTVAVTVTVAVVVAVVVAVTAAAHDDLLLCKERDADADTSCTLRR